MPQLQDYLPGSHERGRYMRMDTAQILKRFFFCERALIIAQAGWVAGWHRWKSRSNSPVCFGKTHWCGCLRTRVFELRYPSRLLEIGDDAPVVNIFAAAAGRAERKRHFLLALARVFKPALLKRLPAYLEIADSSRTARRFTSQKRG